MGFRTNHGRGSSLASQITTRRDAKANGPLDTERRRITAKKFVQETEHQAQLRHHAVGQFQIDDKVRNMFDANLIGIVVGITARNTVLVKIGEVTRTFNPTVLRKIEKQKA